MELFILRHAIAVERGTVGYERDSERPLTSKGERRMYDIARGMRALGLSFDCILSSPYERAKRTAEIVAEVFRKNQLAFVDALAVGGDEVELLDYIDKRYRDVSSILLVGHEPYLSSLISLLVAGEQGLLVSLKKGALCKLSVGTLIPGQCATLEWLLTPKVMIQIR